MRMCMLDHFVDCPWRERTIYGGDVYAENLIAQYAFGDPRLNRKTLRQMFAIQYPGGALPPFGPYSGADHFYPSWTAFFALAFVDHYRFTADRGFLEEGWPNLVAILEWAIGQTTRNANGLIGCPASAHGFDAWMQAEKTVFGGWDSVPFYEAFKGGAELARALGDNEKATRYAEAAEHLRAAMRAQAIDPENGMWHSNGQNRLPRNDQADAGYLLWGGVLDEPLARKVAGAVLSPELVPVDAPFRALFVLLGLFRAGDANRALEFIRAYWGEMLARGATTMWEHFSLEWPDGIPPRRGVSFCHAWSAAPTYALPACVLGVTPLAPGFSEVAIAPQPGDLAWARGDVPTPHGIVHVEWTRADGRFTLRINLPAGTAGRLTLPPMPAAAKVSVNGAATTPVRDNGQLVVPLPAGEHEVIAAAGE